MSTQKGIGDTTSPSSKVENFGSFAKVGAFETDVEDAQNDDECTTGSEEFQPYRVKRDLVVVDSNGDASTQAAAAASADVDARRKQRFEQFEKERQLLIDQQQREEMITTNYHNFDHLHRGKDLTCLEREHESIGASVDDTCREFCLPNVEKGIDPELESSKLYGEVSEEPHCERISHSARPDPASENRPHVNDFSLLSHYVPSGLGDRGISAEAEVDRLSRQVQVLVHQLAGCRQNLLRAEIEVGVLHEENRELRCLIKDLLAACSRP